MQYHCDTIVSWIHRELSAEDAQFVLAKLKLEHVYNTALLAAKYLLKTIDPSKKILIMGNEGTLEEIRLQGFKNAFTLPTDQCGMTEAEFADFSVDDEVKAVISASQSRFDFRKLAIATLYLQNPEVQYVATNDDPVFVSGGSGRLQPDVGATLLPLEVASGRKAVCIGKPEKFCFEMIMKDYFESDKHRWSDAAFLS